MKYYTKLIIPIFIFGCFWTSTPEAAAEHSISVFGQDRAVASGASILLSDIADVTSLNSSDNEAVENLRKLSLGSSPKIGEEVTLSAASILQTIERSGIDMKRIGYTIPRIITVSRAFQEITSSVIADVIKKHISHMNPDANLKKIEIKNSIKVPTGDAFISVSELSSTPSGDVLYSISAQVEGKEEARVIVPATVEQWKMVPVAGRSIPRGGAISPSDIMMARLNIQALNKDVAYSSEDIVGKTVTQDIPSGQIFKTRHLKTPPVIETGSKVMMIVRFGALEATATGTALESGIKDQDIKIRNDSSKKIVIGKVLEPGLVSVTPQGALMR